jgi:predicted nucleic acid-binding protein
MIVLDTNVISALMYDRPDRQIVAWLDRQATSSIWTTSVTTLEIQFGLQIMPASKKRLALEEIFNLILRRIDYRIAPFDDEAARFSAGLMAQRKTTGRVGQLSDAMIAGIVLARHASLATRNVTHFADIAANVVNPWTA